SVATNIWSLAHGISRPERSLDPYAISHAGARVMMQVTTGTSPEPAGQLGLSYDGYRLISDPNYNVMLGSGYFQRMLNIWNGSVPLALASYTPTSGHVAQTERTC